MPPKPDLKTSPPLPGELLAELLTLVGEVNGVLDLTQLLSAIAQALRRIVDYRILDIFLPDEEGFLLPAYVEGYDVSEASSARSFTPSSTSRTARCASPTPGCPTPCTTAPRSERPRPSRSRGCRLARSTA